MKRLLLSGFLFLASLGPLSAQQGQQALQPLGQATLSVTTSSDRVALPTSSGVTSWLYNSGSATLFFKYGTSTVTAATTDFPLPAGACVAYSSSPNTHIAAITAASTATLRVTQGVGMPAGACGGGSGGGAVTVADGADTAQGTTTDTACATDNGTCTEIALLKRENQRLTTLITAVGSPFQASGALAANQSVNLTQILGAAPSLTNPLWVFPATGATFPVSLATNTPTVAASENHIGEVGGNIIPVMNAMTTSNNTVTTGKSVGGLQTLSSVVRVSGSLGASGTSGIIQSVMLTFKDAVGTIPFDVYYFNANPTGSTCTDNTTFALVDADRDKVIFIAHVTDFTAGNTAAIGQAGNMAIPFGIASGTTAYACAVSRGSAAITGTANVSLITRIMRN